MVVCCPVWFYRRYLEERESERDRCRDWERRAKRRGWRTFHRSSAQRLYQSAFCNLWLCNYFAPAKPRLAEDIIFQQPRDHTEDNRLLQGSRVVTERPKMSTRVRTCVCSCGDEGKRGSAEGVMRRGSTVNVVPLPAHFSTGLQCKTCMRSSIFVFSSVFVIVSSELSSPVYKWGADKK